MDCSEMAWKRKELTMKIANGLDTVFGRLIKGVFVNE